MNVLAVKHPTLSMLDNLNPRQLQAVETIDGPLLVLAGAGTGKTRVLTTKIAYLATHHGVPLSQILAVTFTNKAAHEMRQRIEAMTGFSVAGLWIGTFHSLCLRMLRVHAERVNLNPDFTILDTDEQLRIIKQILEVEKLDDKKFPPRLVASVINRWKDRGWTAENILEMADDPRDTIVRIYPQYQQRLKILNALDFGDLLLFSLQLFQKCPDVLEKYHRQFRYILVDEYQDTNTVQYLWLKALSSSHGNICCVGDEDQSIYGWRGAEITNILKFENDFVGAQVIRLEQNYRSTTHILGAASGLITKNTERLGKTLWTDVEGGEKITIQTLWDSVEEARVVAEEIESLQRKGLALSQMAILVRASYLTREFEDRFLTLGIPYRVIGGSKFYERQEIRDALAYLRIVVKQDDGLAFERIVNTPRRGIGESTLKVLHQASRQQGWSLIESAKRLIETDELRPAVKRGLSQFLNQLDTWRYMIKELSPADLARHILEDSGYVAMWQSDKAPDSVGRLENLKELINAIANFETLLSFLDHVSLITDNLESTRDDSVNIMTLHSAKGLEFDTVFLSGWEESVFPNPRALEENGGIGLEEERRLAYVGLTRAQRKAIITSCVNRRVQGRWQSHMPSRFLGEIPREHIDIKGGLHQGLPEVISLSERTIQSLSVEKKHRVGQKVFHIKFGYGKITRVDGEKLDVIFECSGLKKVLASFIEMA